MKLKPISKVKTKEEARNIAIEWQNWQSSKRLSFNRLWKIVEYFDKLAGKFDLYEEFRENGII